MSAILLAGPAAEPLLLPEAKAFLRIVHDDDDALIAALIAAARGQIEALTRRALLSQTWRIVLDRWPKDGRITPRIGPLRSVIAARVFVKLRSYRAQVGALLASAGMRVYRK